ncbi:MAG: hypothetical protein NDF55_10515 [archaeon GB-1867-005]|nr:hypothetical protein [Candidatus Culexmicrobium cathedralense]
MVELKGLCECCPLKHDCPIFEAFIELNRYDWVVVEGEIHVKVCDKIASLSPEELGKHIGKIMAKKGVFLRTEKPLNIVEIMKEEWQ